MDSERCVDLEVDDGVVTILNRLATWNDLTGIVPTRMSMDGFDICVVLCCGCTSNSIARTNQEFERYANIEILEFIHVCIANYQAGEGPMRTMNAHRLTIFHDVKIEVAVFMMKPNEESRRWLNRMRVWSTICAHPLQSLSVAESKFVEFARSEHMKINLMKVLRNVLVVRTTTGVSQSNVEWGKFDSCCAWCFGHKNV